MSEVVVISEDAPDEAPPEMVVIEAPPEPPPSEQLAAQELLDRHDEDVTAEAEHQEKHRYTAEKLSEHDIALTACNDAITRLEQGLDECRNLVSTRMEEDTITVLEEEDRGEEEEIAVPQKRKPGLLF